jgi:hypothetical protein
VRVCRQVTGRSKRACLSLVVVFVLPLLGCASYPSNDYAADVYPSQSLANLFQGTSDSSPPVRTAALPPQPSSSIATMDSRASGPPTGSSGAATEPAPTSPGENSDLAAAAYPSVSLMELLSKPASH